MASNNRQPNFNIKDQLFKYSRKFSFIQAYRLLNLLLHEESSDQLDQENRLEYIAIRPELSLEFPTSDIVSIEKIHNNDKLIYQITATFLGLYGSSSPLPTFYTENLFREEAEDNCLNRKFIDIFNNHLYQIFFEIWSTHRISYQIFEKKNDRYLSYLCSIGGAFDINTLKSFSESYNPLRYLNILGHLPKTAYWLKTLLADLLEIDSIEIHECIDKILPIPEEQRLNLGIQSNILGESTHLGEQIISTNHTFSVQIGPISYHEYKSLMPKTPKFKLINQIIKSYLDIPLIWNIKFLILDRYNTGIQLGITDNAYLGYDTWLFGDNNPNFSEYQISFENPLDLSN